MLAQGGDLGPQGLEFFHHLGFRRVPIVLIHVARPRHNRPEGE